MSTINQKNLTILDWAKRKDPDGAVATVGELLSQQNEVLTDMVFKEGNLEFGERLTMRTGLPDVYWRLMNQGVPSSKSRTAQVDEGCGMLEARGEVDVDLAALNGNVNAFRLSEMTPFLEAMGQEHSSTLFYGNSSVAPQEFNGLAIRYSSTSAANGQNIILGGGAGGDNTSIWLIGWGEQSCYGVFPKGSQAGLQHKDLGEGDAFDGSNNRFRAYMDKFQWKTGLALKDWRFVVRVPNIDVSNLVGESSNADIIKLMIKMSHRPPSLKMAKFAYYMNRTVFEMLDVQRFNAVKGAGMTYQEVDGKLVPMFRGIPIRICDSITNSETLVS